MDQVEIDHTDEGPVKPKSHDVTKGVLVSLSDTGTLITALTRLKYHRANREVSRVLK